MKTRIHVVQGDITKLAVDVIVKASVKVQYLDKQKKLAVMNIEYN